MLVLLVVAAVGGDGDDAGVAGLCRIANPRQHCEEKIQSAQANTTVQ